MNTHKYRESREVIYDILKVISNYRNLNKHSIGMKSNLCGSDSKYYFNLLLNKKIIEIYEYKKRNALKREFILTEKGYCYIEYFEKMKEILT